MKLTRALAILVLILSASVAMAGPIQQPRYLEMTFLTTNDLHANLLPFDEDPSLQGKVPEIKSVGGAARRATLIRKIRSEMRTPVFLLDCGDATYGASPLAKAYHGKPDVEVMNAIGYDAMAAGNHEFEWPAADVLRNIRASRFPWICSNIVDANDKLLFTPYFIRDIQGVRVAFFGLVNSLPTEKPRKYKAAAEMGIKILNPQDTAAKLVTELRQKADIVVLISHLGIVPDTELAGKLSGIDIILGGHSHTRLPKPKFVPAGEPDAFYIGSIPITQAHRWGGEMGRTKVVFHRDAISGRYTLMSCKSELLSINSSIPDDPQVAGIIQRYLTGIQSKEQK